MTYCIIYLASPRSFMTGRNNTGHLRYDVLRASLLMTRRVLPNTDVIVFHEDYTDDDIQGLPRGITFVKIDFTGFESIYNPQLSTSRGYLMMCRFFSGVVQSHPLLQKFTHYIRLDDDSYFLEPYITDTLIQQLCNSDYAYRSVFRENKPQQSLYEFTMKFLDRRLNIIQKLHIQKELVLKGIITNKNQYTGLAPYNNFHLSSIRLWNHPLVREYIRAIETSGGIFRYGWLDANIHAMIVFLFPYVIPSLTIYTCTSFGYRHNCHVSRFDSLNIDCDETLPFYPIWLNDTILPEELRAPDVTIPYTGSIEFVVFANTEYMPLDRIVSHAKNFNVFNAIHAHTELDFPSFFEKHRKYIHLNRLNGYGRWIWKPMIILENLLSMKDGDILVYTDAGVHLNKRGLPRFVDYIRALDNPSKCVVSFATHFKNAKYAHPDAIVSYFPDFSYEAYRYHYAGVILVKRTDESVALVREWLSLCENYEYLNHFGGDGDNGLYNLCVSKHLSMVNSVYPDEVAPADGNWDTMIDFPFQYRRIRPSR